ncbi:hypothetical protein EV643_1204 [Kribbella sp. VKM Ac-2527]|uniref:MerR-like DNA binding protein n=1 Tax=Kribbella caucasensis TaxID=2512215 RepID=A0A4R6JJB8_9ACTN|nr:hypothetical protein [Kribbella sp. VKM Ac-2527]TDO36274.1 hypothetical protein EV643_1204 [Kribbella sp. VKM Ac-2527]
MSTLSGDAFDPNAIDDVDRVVEELAKEYYPGNNSQAPWEPAGWDNVPRGRRVQRDPETGRVTELFLIGALAFAMNRKPLTIRLWERKGIIPKVQQAAGREGSQHGGRRLYTRAQIEGMIVIAREDGLLSNDRRPIESTNFTPRVAALFDRLAVGDT